MKKIISATISFLAVYSFLFPYDSKNLEDYIYSIKSKMISIRRDIHANPELSNREFQTSRMVADYLRKLGLDVREKIAGTGVVGILWKGDKYPTVAIRADMDALPIEEKNDVEYRSKVKGVMHACGHDFHTTILLGTAEVLTKFKNILSGNVLFVFQPAEEGAPPGEEGGAYLMIKEGLFKILKPSCIFALHVSPDINVGKIGYTSGFSMANADSFKIEIEGKSAHGAYPHQGIDAILASSLLITQFQSIPARFADVNDPVVVTVGKIDGGVRSNVLAERVEMEGTIRTLSDKARNMVLDKINKMLEGMKLSFGIGYKFDVTNQVPSVYNNPELTEWSVSLLKRILGKENCIELKPQMTAEDFGFYSKEVPAFFFWLGVGNKEKGFIHGLHTPYFDGDEDAISVGIRAFVNLAIEKLNEMKK